jgi:hypothetical protein
MPDQLTPAALRFQAERRRNDLIRQRILGLRAATRTMPVKEIAFRVGVSADYVEIVLAQAPGPRQ